jgi:opacity protein-like surface antigen
MRTLLLIFLASVFALAQAQEIGPYVGASLGTAKLKDWCKPDSPSAFINLVACDDTAHALKLFGGYRFHRNFAGEVSFTSLGTVTATVRQTFAPGSVVAGPDHFDTDVQADNAMLGAALMGILPIGRLDLFAKLGIQSISQTAQSRGTGSLPHGNSSAGSRAGVFGAGATWNLNRNFGVRGEWEYTDRLKASVVSAGALYKF